MPDEAIERGNVVRVELGERSYDISIGEGLLEGTGRQIKRLLPAARAIVVSDQNVADYHLDPLIGSLAAATIGHATHVIDAGEASKSFGKLEEVVDAILAAKLERGDLVIALGGGVIGDLAGSASGIARRGMNLVQIPTSLLAQVDSSVGGKTGIYTPRGKNLVGLFFQPRLVIADTAVLSTLPERHFRGGYAEIAKYGLINDADFFSWLEANWQYVFAGGASRQRAIATSCSAKAAIVAADEREVGDRALLNLGHTFGHAFETATGYSDRLIHGEAISIGMVMAADFSARAGHCATDIPVQIRSHLAAVGLPTELGQIPGEPPETEQLMDLITQDKKVTRGQLSFVLLRGIGQAFVAKDVAASEVSAGLETVRAG